jgi:hypothetical protein
MCLPTQARINYNQRHDLSRLCKSRRKHLDVVVQTCGLTGMVQNSFLNQICGMTNFLVCVYSRFYPLLAHELHQCPCYSLFKCFIIPELRQIFDYVVFSSQMLDANDEKRHYTLVAPNSYWAGDRLTPTSHLAGCSRFYSLPSGKCYDTALATYLPTYLTDSTEQSPS